MPITISLKVTTPTSWRVARSRTISETCGPAMPRANHCSKPASSVNGATHGAWYWTFSRFAAIRSPASARRTRSTVTREPLAATVPGSDGTGVLQQPLDRVGEVLARRLVLEQHVVQ